MPLLAATVLLHLALLWLFLGMRHAAREHDVSSKGIDVVWANEPVTRPKHDTEGPWPRTRPLARRNRPALPAPAASVAPVTTHEEQAVPEAPQPVFDRGAALAAARKLASEPDAARLATVGGQIDARRKLSETQDEKLGREIAEGKRSACLTANGGGSLLTPLMWLIDKKGHGCKF
ncbi:MAG: hypothetical protein V4484_13895 [Pseudomonadota bacterium]